MGAGRTPNCRRNAMSITVAMLCRLLGRLLSRREPYWAGHARPADCGLPRLLDRSAGNECDQRGDDGADRDQGD